ncbi:MAG: hypothetical protein J6N15_10805 [Ruminiclostridium sp.]|nr:hypothetical protein [Ruminiclostridium sp.]
MSNEKKYTDEEIKAIADEELRKAGFESKRKLSPDELENVAGGARADIPQTHEDIDKAWDLVESAWKAYGEDVAEQLAKNMNLLRYPIREGERVFGKITLDQRRNAMHDVLDGKTVIFYDI